MHVGMSALGSGVHHGGSHAAGGLKPEKMVPIQNHLTGSGRGESLQESTDVTKH